VYVTPFLNPPSFLVVAGGDPVTTTGVWAVVPMYGVMV
jgi:hypothetical protein